MKTYVFDIDGTICTNTNGEYELAEPFEDRIVFINQLYNQGHTIKYFTARGSTTSLDWRGLTENQLKKWGALYHELILGKPYGDIFIDDKGFNCNQWIFPSKNDMSENLLQEEKFIFTEPIKNNIEVMNKLLTDHTIPKQLNKLCKIIQNTFEQGGKIIFAGNGGSFADSQHIAAEFVCKLSGDRSPLPAIALGTNSSNLTAIGNDYGFDKIFSREFESMASSQDLLLAFTTSGNSKNIINLIEKAKEMSVDFFILTGKTGGSLSKYNDRVLNVPSNSTALVQQFHIQLGHILVQLSEKDFINAKN